MTESQTVRGSWALYGVRQLPSHKMMVVTQDRVYGNQNVKTAGNGAQQAAEYTGRRLLLGGKTLASVSICLASTMCTAQFPVIHKPLPG